MALSSKAGRQALTLPGRRGLILICVSASLCGRLAAQSPVPLLGPTAGSGLAFQPLPQVTLPLTRLAEQPVLITLDEAIRRAERNEPVFAASLASHRTAELDRTIARNALLPGVLYHNQVLYTQPNGDQTTNLQGPGTQPSPRFIANNAVREYASQALVTETIALQQAADRRLATATAARATAEAEVARRGLVATVASLYYNSLSAGRKLTIAQRAQQEAHSFTELTQKREQGRESAHADVVKAQLLEQQRVRDLSDAVLNEERARLELAVLLFADPHTSFVLAGGTSAAAPLPTRSEVAAAAARSNPALAAALAAVGESDAEVERARAAYLPSLGLSFAYGIDAPQFATNGPATNGPALNGPALNGGGTGTRNPNVRNLGYSAAVTLDIPVWDWLSTDKRVKQQQIRRQATEVALSDAQKRLIIALDEDYSEALTAQRQGESLLESVSTAEESLRLTKLRYSAGEATVLEVVDAQAALTLAENASADGELRYRASLANLQTLTGTL